ncbi:hypothetical protein BRIN106911_24190 [Brevibacillus invocatus]
MFMTNSLIRLVCSSSSEISFWKSGIPFFISCITQRLVTASIQSLSVIPDASIVLLILFFKSSVILKPFVVSAIQYHSPN